MSENPTQDADRPDEEQEHAEHPGTPADVGAVPGEQPKDDPDEEGEDRFDAG